MFSPAALLALAALLGLTVAVLLPLLSWRKTKKTWCVLVYLVSRDSNAKFQWPDLGGWYQDDLDVKLDQVTEALDDLPCGSFVDFVQRWVSGQSGTGIPDWDSVHVVYRAVWNEHIRPPGKPEARVKAVTWQPGAPTLPDNQYFGTSLPNPSDRDGFFQWAYDNFPADHYAVFFWGHSLGPGGLFELNNSVVFPAPPNSVVSPASLVDVRDLVALLVAKREASSMYTLGVGAPTGPGVTTGPASQGGQSLAGAAPKIEVVLFQDCWMSTLETAYELKDFVRYVLGSQSLVPIGYEYDANKTFVSPLGPVWPYQTLIESLLVNPTGFAPSLMAELQTFFGKNEADRLPSSVTTFSLLDLGSSDEVVLQVTPALQKLVCELAPLTALDRWTLFYDHWVLKFKDNDPNKDLDAGEWALVDLRKLCVSLTQPGTYASINPPNAAKIRAAAQGVLDVVWPNASTPAGTYCLVPQMFESPSGGAVVPLGFGGISALWIPGTRAVTPNGDPYIADQIDGNFYKTLNFVTETAPPGQAGWVQYAFEQKYPPPPHP